jgi:hypothetical protein
MSFDHLFLCVLWCVHANRCMCGGVYIKNERINDVNVRWKHSFINWHHVKKMIVITRSKSMIYNKS